ncbi:MAG: hypothetical protein Q9219_006119 [cf. Caloplaca sp. 3 TL-2023]
MGHRDALSEFSLNDRPFTSAPQAAKTLDVSDDWEPSSDEHPGIYERSGTQGSKNERLFLPRKKLQLLASKTKGVTKRLLHAPDPQDRLRGPSTDSVQPFYALRDDAAFNVDRLDTEHQSDKGMAEKLRVNLRTATAGIMHPKQGVKDKATRSTAGHLSRMERPYLSRNMDVELLKAHDHLSGAQSLADPATYTSNNESNSCDGDRRDKVEQLEARRESLRVAYTTSRFIRRARVVPRWDNNLPKREQSMKSGDRAENFKGDINLLFYTHGFSAQYIDDCDELPFEIDSIRQQLERLVIASAPWQEPLLEDLGPYMQLQLHDLANLLEVCAKCPKYRYLVSPIKWVLWDIPTDAEWSFQYLRKNAQTTREQAFKQYPDQINQDRNESSDTIRCRNLVQVVPDMNNEGGILQKHVEVPCATAIPGVLNSLDIFAYRAYWQGVVGRFIIRTGGVRFVMSVKRSESWRRSFPELAEMTKKEGSLVSKLPGISPQVLELRFIDGCKFVLEGMKDRDSAFNTIIGFSGLQWQSLQAKPDDKGI